MQFEAGSVHTAKAVMRNPTNAPFDYQGILFMGVTQAAMALVNFSLVAGESKEVSFPVTMPTVLGVYPVYIGVYSGVVFLEPLRQGENVTIIAPVAAEFYMPAAMRKRTYPTIDPYTVCEVWVDVTNNGDVPGTHVVHIWDSKGGVPGQAAELYITVNLEPGETKTCWRGSQWISSGSYQVRAQGDWVGNNFSEARFNV